MGNFYKPIPPLFYMFFLFNKSKIFACVLVALCLQIPLQSHAETPNTVESQTAKTTKNVELMDVEIVKDALEADSVEADTTKVAPEEVIVEKNSEATIDENPKVSTEATIEANTELTPPKETISESATQTAIETEIPSVQAPTVPATKVATEKPSEVVKETIKESVKESNKKPVKEPSFTQALKALQTKSYKNKEKAIEQLVLSKDKKVQSILEAMLNARLFYTKADKTTVIGIKNKDGFAITSVIDQKDLGTVSKSKLKKIKVNNKLRRILRANIAALSLTDPSPKARLSAVKQMYGKLNASGIALIKEHLETEKDDKVIAEINTLLSINKLDSDDKKVKLAAIDTLSKSLQSEVKNKLESLKDSDDVEIATAATSALQNIDEQLSFYEKLNTAFFGLSLGSVLVLAAIGLAITFGVMGVINMAHGELIMLGAYTTYVIQHYLMPQYIGLSLLVAVPAAFVVSGLVGILIEKLVIRHLYGRPLETLLATFGISLILQQAVRTIFSPLNRSVETPQWMSGSLEINPALSLTYNRLYIILFCLAVFFLLFMIIKKTSLGLSVRAVSQNRSMARAMGIRASRVDALTFGLGSGIAGIAGVALSQITNVGPNLGQDYIIDSFMVVVFGGVGNLWGTLISGFSLGIANKFMEPWAGAVLAKIMVLVFIILFIQKRPRGLFPQKGRAAEG